MNRLYSAFALGYHVSLSWESTGYIATCLLKNNHLLIQYSVIQEDETQCPTQSLTLHVWFGKWTIAGMGGGGETCWMEQVVMSPFTTGIYILAQPVPFLAGGGVHGTTLVALPCPRHLIIFCNVHIIVVNNDGCWKWIDIILQYPQRSVGLGWYLNKVEYYMLMYSVSEN